MNYRNWIITAALISVLLLSTGCETTTDPRKGGLVGGLHGLFSGAYDRRVIEQQQRLGAAQQEGQFLESDTRQLGSEANQTAAQQARLRQQLTALDARTQKLTAQARPVPTDTEAQRQQRAELDRDLHQVRTEIARLKQDVDRKKKSAEEAERQGLALQAEADELAKVANALQ